MDDGRRRRRRQARETRARGDEAREETRGRTFERSDGVFNPPRVAVGAPRERRVFLFKKKEKEKEIRFATAGGKRYSTPAHEEKSREECTVDRFWIDALSLERFNREYRDHKPVVVRFIENEEEEEEEANEKKKKKKKKKKNNNNSYNDDDKDAASASASASAASGSTFKRC